MAIVNSVNNTTPAPTEAPKSSGAAPKGGKTPTPPTTRIAEQAIQTMAAKEAEAGSAPVISRRVSPLRSTSQGTESSSTSTSSSATLKAPAKKSVVAELEENVENLSQTAQDLFADALTRYQSAVAGLLATFKSTNEDYHHSEGLLGQDAVRQRFKKLKESEESRYTNMRYNKALLERRVTCLHKTIMKLFVEFGLLQHSIIGNDHVLQSTVRYGADYRLWEMGTPDNTDEKISIAIKDDSKESSSTAKSTASSAKTTEQSPTNRDNLTRMLHEMVALKERVTVCFEALRLTMYPSFNITRGGIIGNLPFQQKIRDDIATSEFPRKHYLIYSQQFKDLNERINLAVGLNEKPAAIVKRQRQLADILSQMQAHFKLGKEETPATVPVEEVLSDACTEAFDLINQITTLKEDIVVLSKSDVLLGTPWDNKTLLLRQAVALKKRVTAFKTGDMAQRLEAINKEMGTYKAYMDIIKGKMEAIDGHFKALEAASRSRTAWKLDPTDAAKEVPSTPAAPQVVTSSSSTSSSSGWRLSSLFSWGTTSTVPATTAATTTTSTTTVTPVEASAVATTTVSTTIPDPVTITAPATASTVTATTTASTSTTTIPAAPATAT